jgi:hypothetical protein
MKRLFVPAAGNGNGCHTCATVASLSLNHVLEGGRFNQPKFIDRRTMLARSQLCEA